MPQDTSLHKACYEGNNNVVLSLLNENAQEDGRIDVNARGAQERTPLHRAAGAGHSEVITTLLSFNADINAIDKLGRTPLHWAALSGHENAVKTLIASPQININIHALNGWSALHAAASANHVGVINLLLGAEIDPTLIDENGNNAYQVGVTAGFKPPSKLKDACNKGTEKKKKNWFSNVFSSPKVVPKENGGINLEELTEKLKVLFEEQFSHVIQLKIQSAESNRYDRVLEVGIQEAKEFAGQPDCFCIIDCNGIKRKTPIIEKSSNPFFGETFEFDLKDPLKQFTVSIWQESNTGQNLLGVAFVRLAEFTKQHEAKLGVGLENWFQLLIYANKKKNFGSLISPKRRTSVSHDHPTVVEQESGESDDSLRAELERSMFINEKDPPISPTTQSQAKSVGSVHEVPPVLGEGTVQFMFTASSKPETTPSAFSFYLGALPKFYVVPETSYNPVEDTVYDVHILRSDDLRSRSSSIVFTGNLNSNLTVLMDKSKIDISNVYSYNISIQNNEIADYSFVLRITAWNIKNRKTCEYLGEANISLDEAFTTPSMPFLQNVQFLLVATPAPNGAPTFTSNSSQNAIVRRGSLNNSSMALMNMNAPIEYKEIGLVRLKVKYEEEIMIPIELYTNFIDFLCEPRFPIAKLLTHFQEYKESLVLSLIKVYIKKEKLFEFFNEILADEIEKDSQSTIFRGNSIATKAIDLYMKMVGRPFLEATLKDILDKIFSEKKSCEINPAMMAKGEDLKENIQNLHYYTSEIFKKIFENVHLIPDSLIQVFLVIKNRVAAKYPDLLLPVHSTAISAFIFLRYICPAILSPKLFHLRENYADPKTNRTLTLIAKIIQNAANLVEFAEKEQYMTPMSEILVANFPKVCGFIYSISNYDTEVKQVQDSLYNSINLEKEIMYVERFLRYNLRDKCFELPGSCHELSLVDSATKLASFIDDLAQKRKNI